MVGLHLQVDFYQSVSVRDGRAFVYPSRPSNQYVVKEPLPCEKDLKKQLSL